MTDKIQSSSQILLLGTNMFSVILVYFLSCLCLRLHSLSGHDAWSDVFLMFMHIFFISLTTLVSSRSQKQWVCLMYLQNGMVPSTMVQLLSKKTWDKQKQTVYCPNSSIVIESCDASLWMNGVQYQEEEMWFSFPLAMLMCCSLSAGDFG